ncbi:fatty acyl-AMP ligase [Myxococcus fulvus]|uniref:fatty acyl-AMP ligase n=1 Tax=Myxococcus TaxID=32 RepID=UPI0020BF5523|nr:fatty acyl-AMP ligase [Myxococcus fulvus]MCK8498394.1 fatty acyl-AMP ligase [Myxococcus fulvus]
MQTRYPSLVTALRTHASDHPEDRAYVFLGERGEEAAVLTYAELDRRATALARVMAAKAGPGERALLAFPPGLEFLVAFFACQYAGIVAVPTILPRQMRLRDSSISIVEDCAPRLGLTTAAAREAVSAAYAQVPAARSMEWLGVEANATDDSGPPLAVREPDPNAITLLQYTSGSTSAPKGVMVSHGNLCANVEMISQGGDLWRHATRVGWIPMYHDMGLIFNALQGAYVGAQCVLMSPQAFVAHPLSWPRAISTYRAEMAIAPNFAYDLCLEKYDAERMKGTDLSCWELALNGAEPVRASTITRFAEVFAAHGLPRFAPRPTYGMAEATLQISVGKRGSPPRLWNVGRESLQKDRALAPAPGERSQDLVGCGRALTGEKLAIVAPDSHQRLPPGHVGEIWVHGPNVAHGYWQKADATREIFEARIVGEDGATWLRTGDLGCMDDTGELFITGRLKDILIIRGSNFYPQDLELTAEKSHPAIRRGHSAAFTLEGSQEQEQLVIACEVREDQIAGLDVADVVGAVRRAVVHEHELTTYKVLLTTSGAIPRTTSGKIRRKATRELWQKEQLPLVGQS